MTARVRRKVEIVRRLRSEANTRLDAYLFVPCAHYKRRAVTAINRLNFARRIIGAANRSNA